MYIEPDKFHLFAEMVLSVGERSRAEQDGELPAQTRHIKPDGSPVCMTDLLNEDVLVGGARELWPDIGIVAEERSDEIPQTELCLFIDPLDATREFLNRGPRWSIAGGMLCFAEGGMPLAGIFIQPKLNRYFKVLRKSVFGNHAGIWRYNRDEREWTPFIYQSPRRNGKLRLGTDFGPTSPSFYKDEVDRVLDFLKKKDRIEGDHPVNVPAVHACIEVLTGNLSVWWTHTGKPWDFAGPVLGLTECGKVAENLYGGPIPWATNGKGNMRVAPVMLADSEESAELVRAALEI